MSSTTSNSRSQCLQPVHQVCSSETWHIDWLHAVPLKHT